MDSSAVLQRLWNGRQGDGVSWKSLFVISPIFSAYKRWSNQCLLSITLSDPPFLPRWTIFLCLSAPSLHWATRGTLCPSPTLRASTSRPIPVQTVVHFSTRRTSGRLSVKSSTKHWRYLTLHGNISTGRCIVYPRPEQFLVVLFDLVSVPKHLYYFSGMACAKQPGCSSCQLASQVNKERGVRGHHSPESQDRSTSCHLEE